MPGRTITIDAADGAGSFAAYLSVPEGGSGPGLLLAQEIFGINATMRAVADGFAEEGYVCLVPDLFWRMQPGIELGYGEADFEKAFGFYGRFDVDKGVDDLGPGARLLACARRMQRRRRRHGVLPRRQARLFWSPPATTPTSPSPSTASPSTSRSTRPIASTARSCSTSPAATRSCRRKPCSGSADALGGRPGVEIFEYPEVDHAFYNRDRDDVFPPAFGDDGAFALHRRAAQGAGAGLRPQRAVGGASRPRIRPAATRTPRWRPWWRSPMSTTSR